MKRSILYLITVVALIIFIACDKEKGNGNSKDSIILENDSRILSKDQIIITRFPKENAIFEMGGKGRALIDLGNGGKTISETLEKTDEAYKYSFLPVDGMASDIIITGSITEFECYNVAKLDISNNTALTKLVCKGYLTELEVSKHIALTHLECTSNTHSATNHYNDYKSDMKLTALDVSNNIALAYLDCSYNNFTTAALNALFESLHDNPIPGGKTLKITLDYYTQYADISIAEKKGWKVEVSIL